MKLEQNQDANVRRVFDLQKLRKSLNRLKSDLHVFKLSKQLQKYSARQKQDGSGEASEEAEQKKSNNDSGQNVDSD